MLTVTKQAATEAEAEAILDASYLVQKPFGVPVMFVDPADYPSQKFLGIPLPRILQKRSIEKKLAETILQCPPSLAASSHLVEDRGYIHEAREKISGSIMRTIKAHHFYDDRYLALALPIVAPRISVVFYARVTDVLAEELPHALNMDRERFPSLPGTNAQHHFIALWHEIAHSVSGTNEAGADLTSAMAYRHAFDDISVLKFQGDLRATHLVMQHTNPVSREAYGWSCVEAFDSVAALKTPPTWDEVYRVGSTSYDAVNNTRADTIALVGSTLKKQCWDAFRTRDLNTLSNAAETMADDGTFESDDAKMMARRFTLATRRLSQGITAY